MDMIPLSWTRSGTSRPVFDNVRLPLSGLKWIHSAEIPARLTFEDVYNELMAGFGTNIVIRGCRSDIAEFLLSKGFGAVRTGAEGVIDLENLCEPPASVRALVNRGLRHGIVEEIPFSEMHERRVREFKSVSAHGAKPELRYLFNTSFHPRSRCFVLRTPEDLWLGAVTVSMASGSSAHAEMILRRKNVPTGIMEALFAGIIKTMKGEGLKQFSLGEVPFVSPPETAALTPGSRITERLLHGAGRVLRYAYDYEGLYGFKNKFCPSWEPVYVCAPEISWRALADLFLVSRFCALSGSELISSVKACSLTFINR